MNQAANFNKTKYTDNPEIPIRHMEFEFDPSRMRKLVWENEAFGSAYILTFSALIPSGERLVIETIRHYRERIKDPELKARVNGLIGQEAMHSKVHEEFNAAYEVKGIPMNKISRMGERIFLKVMPALLPKKVMLGITCIIEHMTAKMAEKSFTDTEIVDLLDKPARDFLIWHLLEECEHKSVAYDVYMETVGSHRIRMISIPILGLFSGFLFLYAMPLILRTPGFTKGGRKKKPRSLKWWFGRRGYFQSFGPVIADYRRKDFHPNQSDTTELLAEWREKVFGEEGMLIAQVRKTILPGVK